jgi:hypothetical protein
MDRDIVALNIRILNAFDAEIAHAKLLKKVLLKYKSDDYAIACLNAQNNAIDNECGKRLYIAETITMIHEYVALLKNPVNRGDKTCAIANRKRDIANQYFDIIARLVREKKWQLNAPKSAIDVDVLECPTCKNVDAGAFETDEYGKKTCLICASEIKTIEIGNTHLDFNRVTIVGKFIYNRVVHFQDCIKQFQGKQNCKIPPNVFSDLEEKFKAYRLLIDTDNKQARYSKITNQHMLMFLKELKHVKHYENVNVIYNVLTSKRVDDISHLEQRLIEDFKELVTLYDNLHSKDKPEEISRKNFLNVSYLLFQLLRRHGYDCKIEDFSILKTWERKQFHDNICCNLFQKLGWNFTPTF